MLYPFLLRVVARGPSSGTWGRAGSLWCDFVLAAHRQGRQDLRQWKPEIARAHLWTRKMVPVDVVFGLGMVAGCHIVHQPPPSTSLQLASSLSPLCPCLVVVEAPVDGPEAPQTVYVGGIVPGYIGSKDRLLEVMAPFGRITACVFKQTIAFVTFARREDADRWQPPPPPPQLKVTFSISRLG